MNIEKKIKKKRNEMLAILAELDAEIRKRTDVCV